MTNEFSGRYLERSAVGGGSPEVRPRLGHEVADEVLQQIGAASTLRQATIISYNMQDYNFEGQGHLSDLLKRQIVDGARVVVMTTPPPGKSGNRKAFQQKLTLLEKLSREGAEVHLNERLHAKAYLFQKAIDEKRTIVGSPNLTDRGFGLKRNGNISFLELALSTTSSQTYGSTQEVIESRLYGDSGTMTFEDWTVLNADLVLQAKKQSKGGV